MMRTLPWVILIACGCGDPRTLPPEPVDEEEGPPSRAERIEFMALATCDRQEVCENVGDDEEFDDYDECVAEFTEAYEDLWPATRCPADSFDDPTYEDCRSRARNADCDDDLGDLLRFLGECNANQVCSD